MLTKIRTLINRPQVRETWQQLTKTNKVNVNESERLTSLIAGGLLTLFGLTGRSPKRVGTLLSGGYLIYRGLTGHCPGYEAVGFSTASRTERLQFHSGNTSGYDQPQQAAKERTINAEDLVDEMALESFPASDPPATW